MQLWASCSMETDLWSTYTLCSALEIRGQVFPDESRSVTFLSLNQQATTQIESVHHFDSMWRGGGGPKNTKEIFPGGKMSLVLFCILFNWHFVNPMAIRQKNKKRTKEMFFWCLFVNRIRDLWHKNVDFEGSPFWTPSPPPTMKRPKVTWKNDIMF